MTRVVHFGREKCDVYIGRPSMFGNPFTCEAFGRERCLRAYRAYFYARLDMDPEFERAVQKLKSKTLGCWCVPKACHGDIIAEYLGTGECQHGLL